MVPGGGAGDYKSDINITPLVDVVLVLLIKATFTRALHKRVAGVLEGPPSIEGPMRSSIR